MSTTHRLSEAETADRLGDVPGWSLDGASLYREFRFDDFAAAFAFMSRVAEAAERSVHHPEWSNDYGLVRIRLTTHEVGGLSQRDFDLARAIDSLLHS